MCDRRAGGGPGRLARAYPGRTGGSKPFRGRPSGRVVDRTPVEGADSARRTRSATRREQRFVNKCQYLLLAVITSAVGGRYLVVHPPSRRTPDLAAVPGTLSCDS